MRASSSIAQTPAATTVRGRQAACTQLTTDGGQLMGPVKITTSIRCTPTCPTPGAPILSVVFASSRRCTFAALRGPSTNLYRFPRSNPAMVEQMTRRWAASCRRPDVRRRITMTTEKASRTPSIGRRINRTAPITAAARAAHVKVTLAARP
jgi:hypothetical protein